MAGSPLIGLLCLATRLAALWGRVTAFLKKLLIGGAEGEFLPTVTARNLHISGHKTPCEGIVQPKTLIFCKDSFRMSKDRQNEAPQEANGLGARPRCGLFEKQSIRPAARQLIGSEAKTAQARLRPKVINSTCRAVFPVTFSRAGTQRLRTTEFCGVDEPPILPSPTRGEYPRQSPTRSKKTMKNQLNAVLLSAALAGLAGGSAVAAHAATQTSVNANSAKVMKAGLRYSGSNYDTAKHSCQGKNDCKGQGGCKSGDNGCSSKNSCKGKGGCATDGSKMPGLA